MKRIFVAVMVMILGMAIFFLAVALLPGCSSAPKPPGKAQPINPVQWPKVIVVTNEVIKWKTNTITITNIVFTNLYLPPVDYSKL